MTSRKVPKLTLGMRMLIAMYSAGYGSGEMAQKLKVSRHSVSGWVRGRHAPNHATLVQWADICDTDLHWLETGEEALVTVGGGMSREQLAQALVAQLLGSDGLRGRDSNSQPTGLSLEEFLLRPEEPDWIIDLRDEPARLFDIGYLAPTG